VFYTAEGETVSENNINEWMPAVLKQAGMTVNRKVHILRHTFCSHLAMQGAPAKAIQELAGHTDLTTTMRYMHLAPGSLRAAVDLLQSRPQESEAGNIPETATPNLPSPA
jgi:site-specific recombinase XerD